ncbi:hypothetical protein SARC_12983 [Sphaeroforma arctica JP610]|uniref:RmlD-like substrate binding domain-containing protein n=1 Tax=Sphaeroforma arctica JP610 TaxID=667725 RepID=A0A0L0FCH1_9EUKA|nr:hypothetical protein SARC_12983 [Sphaeroforma arctica JP610]KNC74472.1 hypothetical protein SARC_12983 [Sphaeroforma arctica JP610]|eukprot:XP_014148374.1 hypothetical protein SARC_12983 [Sphaeroforma arctica JP610]
MKAVIVRTLFSTTTVYIYIKSAIATTDIRAQSHIMSYLVFGSTGYIGSRLVALLKDDGKSVHCAKSRIENYVDTANELDEIKPAYVLHAAGLTGRPNIDWCEVNKIQTVQVNVIASQNLADMCYQRGIHMTNYATGCIYDYVEGTEHACGGNPFTEEDEPNYKGSFYSETKIYAEKIISQFPNVLTLRVRMPISADLHPRSFVTKIAQYEKLINYPNSVSVLTELLPISLDMTSKKLTGLYNFTNPGTVSHNEVMDLYREFIDPTKVTTNFSIEEQAKVIKSGRCNNHLDVSKLQKLYPEIPEVHVALRRAFEKMSNDGLAVKREE